MRTFPISGRIDEGWLMADTDESPWILASDDINNRDFKEAFIGNGFVGQRVLGEGEGSGFFPGLNDQPRFWFGSDDDPDIHSHHGHPTYGCLMHGMWDDFGLMDIPHWSSLQYGDGQGMMDRFGGIHEDYRQELDLKRGILTTTMRWISDGNGRASRLKTEILLARHNRNLAIIRTTVIPEFDGHVYFVDSLDGRCIEQGKDWQTFTGRTQFLRTWMGPARRELLVASQLRVDGGAITAEEKQAFERHILRRIRIKAESGQPITVTKAVYIGSQQPGMLTAADLTVNEALRNPELQFEKHIQAWAKLWQHHIELQPVRLQKLVNASLYYFYAQLSADQPWSLGPCGLSGSGWRGRMFWDADLWMAPAMLAINPPMAKPFVAYRHSTMEGARRNAQQYGCEGTRWPWQSAATGDEICTRNETGRQLHVVSEVAMLQKWYGQVSGDDTYMTECGEEVILQSARFWASRVSWNETKKRYDIGDICCPDEFTGIVDNNATTNVSAVQTLQAAADILKKRGEVVPELWTDIMAHMFVPWDHERDIPREHETYNGEVIKQADTSLMVFPFGWPLTRKQQEDTITYYRSKYPEGKIMMSSAMDGIGYCILHEPEKAWECLIDLLPHFRGPFLQVSESPHNETRCFMTGLGGFLLLIIMGFCGVRFANGELTTNPCLPEAIPAIHLKQAANGTSFKDILCRR